MLNVGIIGMGRMGTAHAQFFATNPETKIAAFFDIDPAAVKEGQEKYGAPAAASAAELINNPAVDAIVIASPTYCHAVDAIAAIKSGKPLFCEKPLCRSWAEAMAIKDAADKSQTKLQIGFVRRFSPAQQLLNKIATDGTLGTLRCCNIDLTVGGFKRMPGDWFANFTLSGGVVLDMLSHHLDLISWAFGEPARLYAQGFLEDPRLPEPTDYNSGTITFKNGVICDIQCAWNRFGRSANYMEIYGDNGCASLKWGDNAVTLCKKGGQPEEIPAPKVDNPYFEGFRAWMRAIRENRQPDVNLNDALNALKLALAMIKSSTDNTVINF